MAMDWRQLLSTNRFNSRQDPERRSPFEQDQDRIVFSPAFRRLADKTQVHPLAENDHVRTRLTHSIEVASVGRSLANRVGEGVIARHGLGNERSAAEFGYVVQAACLAHDIGNPPFGHSGEFAIRDWFERRDEAFWSGMQPIERADLQTFEGNAQGFRLLTRLEQTRDMGGMRLTAACLATFLKYPWGSDGQARKAGKFSVFQADWAEMERVAGDVGLLPHRQTGWCRHPLAYLVEAADDICYGIVDIEDGVEIGALDNRDFAKIVAAIADEQDIDALTRWPVGRLRTKAIGVLVEQMAAAFALHEEALLAGEFPGDLASAIAAGEALKAAKELARERIFEHPRKMRTEVAAYGMLGGFLEQFCEAVRERESYRSTRLLKLMGEHAPPPEASRYHALLAVTDFISGMTDRFALRTHNALNGINL